MEPKIVSMNEILINSNDGQVYILANSQQLLAKQQLPILQKPIFLDQTIYAEVEEAVKKDMPKGLKAMVESAAYWDEDWHSIIKAAIVGNLKVMFDHPLEYIDRMVSNSLCALGY